MRWPFVVKSLPLPPSSPSSSLHHLQPTLPSSSLLFFATSITHLNPRQQQQWVPKPNGKRRRPTTCWTCRRSAWSSNSGQTPPHSTPPLQPFTPPTSLPLPQKTKCVQTNGTPPPLGYWHCTAPASTCLTCSTAQKAAARASLHALAMCVQPHLRSALAKLPAPSPHLKRRRACIRWAADGELQVVSAARDLMLHVTAATSCMCRCCCPHSSTFKLWSSICCGSAAAGRTKLKQSKDAGEGQ